VVIVDFDDIKMVDDIFCVPPGYITAYDADGHVNCYLYICSTHSSSDWRLLLLSA